MLDFLRRYQVPVTSGTLLLLAAMLLSANAGESRHADPLARIVMEAVYPFQLATTRMTARVREVWEGYIDLVGVREEAEILQERVRVLEGRVTRLAEVEAANRRLSRLLEFRRVIGERFVAARVIGRSASARDRTITLDKGEADGVAPGAAALVPEGVVGHVFRASPHAAEVLLITDRNSGVDAVVQRSRVHGIVKGRHAGCELHYVKRGAEVEVGDQLVTSGLDGIFPKGVLIGEVTRVRRRGRGLFETVVVQPRVAFEQLEEVLVTVGKRAEAPETPAG